jgi:deoxyribodipyrimidine photo-lyase
MPPVLLWFRRNLRLRDNAALRAAAASGHPVIPVYVSDSLDTGGASRWWLHHSLDCLANSLADIGGRLVIRAGEPETVLAELLRDTGASALYYSCRYEPEARRQEQALRSRLGERLDVRAFDDSLLNHPSTVLTRSDTPFKVFTPYWRAVSARGEPPQPVSVTVAVDFADHSLASAPLAELGLLPTAPDWAAGLRSTWEPGEIGALKRLDALETPVQRYAEQRDRPDLDRTSRLSAHLHFGEVSIRQVWHAIRATQLHLQDSTGAEALLRQLFWRDFSAYLLFHFPELPHTPLRRQFDAFPWSGNEDHLEAWRRGKTGYPIVDAGMRQLWATGWIHNRVRMIVASFLVKLISPTIPRVGSGLPAVAPTRHLTFVFSIQPCRARNSTRMVTTFAPGYPNWTQATRSRLSFTVWHGSARLQLTGWCARGDPVKEVVVRQAVCVFRSTPRADRY